MLFVNNKCKNTTPATTVSARITKKTVGGDKLFLTSPGVTEFFWPRGWNNKEFDEEGIFGQAGLKPIFLMSSGTETFDKWGGGGVEDGTEIFLTDKDSVTEFFFVFVN